MIPPGRRRLLVGRQEILDYLGIGRQAFGDFLRLGMPAAVYHGKWYAHADNLDEFFRRVTRRRSPESEAETEAE